MSTEIQFGDIFAVPLRNGVSYSAARRGSGVPMVNMKEIFAFDRISNEECELAPLTEKERLSYLLESWDLLFARQSLTFEGAGKCSLVLPADGQRTFESHLMRVRLDPAVASAPFYYYYFRSSQGRRNIETIVQQVAAAGIRGSDLASLKVPFPPLPEQRAIAEVLGALDDKIAANTKLAATADELLATRFESIVGATSKVVRLSEIADVNRSTVKPSPDGQLRYVDIASVEVGSYKFPSATLWADAPSRARRGICKGDTLWSTVRPNRRSHALNLSDDPLLVASTGLAVLTARSVGWAYLYELTRRPEFTSYLETVADGSAYPAVRADKFGEALVPLADEASRRSFEQLAEPLREELHSLDQENRTLAATRDTLLPQLMSGKLRVDNAEKVLENAGV